MMHEKAAQVNSTASITKSARETPSMHQVRMPAKRWIVVRHGKWAVDVVACRDHREVRQGVCEGLEGGQGQDPGSGGAGHRLVTRQCPAPAEGRGPTAGSGPAGRRTAAPAAQAEVFLR